MLHGMGDAGRAASREVEAELVQAGRRCPGLSVLLLEAFVDCLEKVLVLLHTGKC